jgi:predicted MPP superfamily phosphohydrolase
MMPFVLLSQPAYAISFWWYACIPISLGYSWFFLDSYLPDEGWFFCPTILGLWGCAWTLYRQQHLSVHRLGDRGIRIVHLSDIHASPVMRGKELSNLIRKVNEQSPDIVFLTGDLVMPFSEENHQYMLDAFSLLDAPLYCCMGNHDLPIQKRLEMELSTDSYKMLIDEQINVEISGTSILIGGLQFHWNHGKEYVESMMDSFVDDADLRIILSHDPRYFRWIREESVDLVLSGHTHGGQVATNMFGVSWSVLRLLGLYDQGFFRKGTCSMYVHKGNWIWGLPPRMGVAPEIALFLL